MQTTPAWLTLLEFLLMLLEESYYLHPGADTCSESKHAFCFPLTESLLGLCLCCSLPALILYAEIKEHFINSIWSLVFHPIFKSLFSVVT